MISLILPPDARVSKKAVFLNCNFKSLQSKGMEAADSSTLARDQDGGCLGCFGLSLAHALTAFCMISSEKSMSNAYRIGTEIPDFREVIVEAARPLSCSVLMKETQKSRVIAVGLSDLTYVTHFFHQD